jgi:biotin carboxyl carrier protein
VAVIEHTNKMKRMSVYQPPAKILAGVLLAALVGALYHMQPPLARAHEGEDHGAGAKAPAAIRTSEAKMLRLADGSVSVPLALQQSQGLRSVVLGAAALTRAVNLPARIIPDPSRSARVVAPLAGTVEAPAAGFPGLGLAVARGQSLVRLRPTFGNQDLADLKAELADAKRDVEVAQQQLDRYKLAGGGSRAPAKAALGAAADPVAKLRIEHAGAVARKAELEAGLARRLTLSAPLGGRISLAEVHAGRVVAPGDLLFEIVDPRHLWVSALSNDTELSPPPTAYAVGADQRRLPVALVGESHRLAGRALPLLYRLIDPPAGLAVGQALTLHLSGGTPLRLPAASLVRRADGSTVVWVQEAPERFRARAVRVRPLDGQTWLVEAGLAPGERVVSAGLALFKRTP